MLYTKMDVSLCKRALTVRFCNNRDDEVAGFVVDYQDFYDFVGLFNGVAKERRSIRSDTTKITIECKGDHEYIIEIEDDEDGVKRTHELAFAGFDTKGLEVAYVTAEFVAERKELYAKHDKETKELRRKYLNKGIPDSILYY